MRWGKRGLWLLAWSFWAWLGWGLYRELPRSLAPPLCKLPISTGESILGFVAEDLVVSESNALAQTTAFTVWDVSTHQARHHVRGPLSVYPQTVAIEHGVVIGIPCNVDAERPTAEDEWHALNLATDEWRSLSVHKPSGILFFEPGICHVNPIKPWIALGAHDGSQGLFVVDLQTGKRVATLHSDRHADHRHIEKCCWLPHDELLVACNKRNGDESLFLERWDVPTGSLVAAIEVRRPTTSAIILGASDAIELPGTGFAIHHTVGPFVILDPRTGDECGVALEAVSVDSLDDGRSLPSAIGTRFPVAMGANATLFAADGSLRGLADGRVLWRPARHETLFGGPSNKSFLVLESWEALFGKRVPWLARTTSAVRDVGTGSLRYRVAGPHPRLDHLSPSGAIGVDWEGAIYRISPIVNYPLLALCQSILALPLILIWVMLRWRRKRQMRMAGAAL